MPQITVNRFVRWMLVVVGVAAIGYTVNYCLKWKNIPAVIGRITPQGVGIVYTRPDGSSTGYIFAQSELPSGYKEAHKSGDTVTICYRSDGNLTALASAVWTRDGLGFGVGALVVFLGLFVFRNRPAAPISAPPPVPETSIPPAVPPASSPPPAKS